MHCKLVCLGYISVWGWVLLKLYWCNFEFLLGTVSSAWPWVGLSLWPNIWASLDGGTCVHLGNWIPTSLRSWPEFLGEGAVRVCGPISGNGWTIFGGPVKGSTGVLWMTSFMVSCRVSLVHCRTWCPMGSSQKEQLFSKLEVAGMAVSSSLLSWSWTALFSLSLLAAWSNLSIMSWSLSCQNPS